MIYSSESDSIYSSYSSDSIDSTDSSYLSDSTDSTSSELDFYLEIDNISNVNDISLDKIEKYRYGLARSSRMYNLCKTGDVDILDFLCRYYINMIDPVIINNQTKCGASTLLKYRDRLTNIDIINFCKKGDKDALEFVYGHFMDKIPLHILLNIICKRSYSFYILDRHFDVLNFKNMKHLVDRYVGFELFDKYLDMSNYSKDRYYPIIQYIFSINNRTALLYHNNIINPYTKCYNYLSLYRTDRNMYNLYNLQYKLYSKKSNIYNYASIKKYNSILHKELMNLF